MAEDEKVQALREAYERFRGLDLPRAGDVVDLGEADIDLYEEDTFLAGLVDSFLARRRVHGASFSLDSSIDRRIERAAPTTPNGLAVKAQFLQYRAAMRGLAAMLESASGLPIKEVDREAQ